MKIAEASEKSIIIPDKLRTAGRVMREAITSITTWVQRQNFTNKSKETLPEFSLTRIENSSLLGTPDLLVYNTSGHFCTIELKGNEK